MPSSITHAYIAKDIYKILDKRVKNIFELNDLDKYIIYSEGPDIFYFYNIFFPITKNSRDIIKLGHYIHNNKVNELFINLTNKVKLSKNKEEFLFLIGLLTHYISDSTIHPYINYKASLENKKRRDVHFKLETYIDNYMINKYENINYKKYKCYEIFKLKENKYVEELLNLSFKEVFNKERIGFYYFKSLKHMKLFFKLFRYDPIGFKRIFYVILNPFAKLIFRDIKYLSYNFNLDKDKEYLNLNHKKWFNIDNKDIKSNDSFIDLYNQVTVKTSNIILKLYEYIYEDKEINLENLFGNKSYSNGLLLK